VRGPRPSNYDQRIKQIKLQIQRLQDAGNLEQAQRLARSLAAFKNRFGESVEPTDNATDTGFDTRQVVTQAFLRTLSRYPSEQELQRSMEFVDEDTDKINGVRGLVWALLNTKEFIVNH